MIRLQCGRAGSIFHKLSTPTRSACLRQLNFSTIETFCELTSNHFSRLAISGRTNFCRLARTCYGHPALKWGARMHSVNPETRHGPGNDLRSLEDRIRQRAHEIWTAHACIDGQADQHWHAAEREILTESTATPASLHQNARSKKSDWRRELRMRFFGMLFGVGIAAVGAAVLNAHRNGSGPASPGTIRETAAPASAPKLGAEGTASKRIEATSVDTDRSSTATDVTYGGKSNVATMCEATDAACGVSMGRADAPNETSAGGGWTNVPETPEPATSPRPALEHTKPVAQRSAAAADRPNTKLGRPHTGDASSGHNGFWAWSR